MARTRGFAAALTGALIVALVMCVAPGDAAGQDVEMLGARYGTRPPPAYYRELARDGDAYRLGRGRARRLQRSSPTAGPALEGGAAGGPAGSLGPRDGPVVGDFTIPVLLGLFDDTANDGPYTAGNVADAYFADAPGTVRQYYDEVSGGRVALGGHVVDWERTVLTRAEVTRNDGALSSATLGGGGIGNFIHQLVQEVMATNPSFDWGRFDNDGPDGMPNSGDDDGFVDALAVIHPTRGAECTGDYGTIWSHKWSLLGALGVTISTSTERFGGGSIRIDDYFVQPALSCDGSRLNEIGIFTHEVAHAFGLPDLYDVRANLAHSGVGSWDLMASGAWGCDNDSPASPCHMGAWTKAMLGWVDVVDLEAGVDHGTRTLPPVQGPGGVVYRVYAQDGSGEYFLLENRAALGFDSLAHAGGGLLVWQVDPLRVAARWGANTVNGSDMPGVRLREADGQDHLLRSGGGNRGDAGDPFPGSTGNRLFHAGSIPASTSYAGSATGLTVTGIARSGDDVRFDLLTRMSTLTLVADGSDGTTGVFRVDGASPQPSGSTFRAAPFSTSVLEAAAGESVEPGIRRPFSHWLDEPSASRRRSVQVPMRDTTLTALYDDGAREIQLSIMLEGGGDGIVPGVVETFPSSPDFWFPEGREISVEVVPRTGFSFTGWSGSLLGAANPALVVMDAPVSARADLEPTYALPTLSFEPVATVPQDIALTALNANAPVTWSITSGTLPPGLTLRSGGVVAGAALEAGTFEVTVRARDAIGLTSEGILTLNVRMPTIEASRAAAHFLQSGTALTDAEALFLDRRGNGDGTYDLGDLRAWVFREEGP